MRTTVAIDDDVLTAAREQARRERRTLGDVLSELARTALTAPRAAAGSDHHGFRPLPQRGPAVSNALIDQLRENEPE